MTTPSDIFRNSVYSILNNVHTAMPGIIVDYDSETNKATIQPALNKNYTTGPLPLPILENVPVMFQRSDSFTFHFPIKEGDYVLLIFVERSIDLWKAVGGQVTPNDKRKFDLSDAIAIPGLMPFTETPTENNNEDFVLSYAGSTIRIKSDGAIVIETSLTVAIGTQTTELLDVLSQTLGFLSSLTAVPAIPSGGSPPQPLTFQASALALQTQLDAIKGTIP
jgi:hypothetical protein